MTVKKHTCLFAALFSVSLPALSAAADTEPPSSCITCTDNAAVSSLLLAAGMYGGLDAAASKQGLDLSLSESAKMFKGVISDHRQRDGQDITLSYTGSEGRLGFSAGYLYTAPENTRAAGTVLLDLNTHSRNVLHEDADKPWYVTLNFAKDFQLNDSVALGIDSRTMLLSTSASLSNEPEGHAVCMSFNLPVSYGGFLTVTPELQWSRALDQAGASNLDASSSTAEKNPNTFYGGMSISFSY
jgi:hypothetical protein